MIDPDDFIEGFLYHAQSKAQISAYNKEYYRRNKHKWKTGNRGIAKTAYNRIKNNQNPLDPSQPIFGDGLNNLPEHRKRVKAREKNHYAREAAREERILTQQRKIKQARAAATKHPIKKKIATLRKLISAQKRLNQLKKKNPFKKTTKVKVRTAKDFPKAFPKNKKSNKPFSTSVKTRTRTPNDFPRAFPKKSAPSKNRSRPRL